MQFALLVLGILVFCGSAAVWVIDSNSYALASALAGLAMIAGEGFKIGLSKELEGDKLEAEEVKLEKDLKDDKLG